MRYALFIVCLLLPTAVRAADPAAGKLDFNRDIRPILATNCFACHGPDDKERKGKLRLDTREGAMFDNDGVQAVVPGHPDKSELIARITTKDADDLMPPKKTGKKLSEREIELLKRWVKEGAPYAAHWSYMKPARPAVPQVNAATAGPTAAGWPRNPIDNFILDRLLREKLRPSPQAGRPSLIRRLSLDITGLPPTVEEVDAFINDKSPDAYEKLVDRLLASPAYGEHWARLWLDLARYADSAGYADDPPRTIWGYRDWVIRAFNDNKPFDQFTVEQLAGDLLAERQGPGDKGQGISDKGQGKSLMPHWIASSDQDRLIATAFHRNTQTNNEGGTNDEEYRNVAMVDRVNTTFAVWMGTTMACAQCHTHKYDPITQEEYFRFYAILNNTADADRRDESPTIELYTPDQLAQKAQLEAEQAQLEKLLATSTPQLAAAQAKWEQAFTHEVEWKSPRPDAVAAKSNTALEVQGDQSILARAGKATDVYTVTLPVEGRLSAIRLEALPHDSLPGKGPGFAGGNFVVTKVAASLNPPRGARPAGRFVRVELPGKGTFLHLAEVQVFSGGQNVAVKGEAKQISNYENAQAKRAIDGNTNGDYNKGSVSHTGEGDNPWWEVDLKSTQPVDRIVIWNRTDGTVEGRMAGAKVLLLDEKRQPVWQGPIGEPPKPSRELSLSGARGVPLAAAFANYAQGGFEAMGALDGKDKNKGWAVGGAVGQAHALTLVTAAPVDVPAGSTLSVEIEQLSPHANHTLGRFRLSVSGDERVADFAAIPAHLLMILKSPAGQRSEDQRRQVAAYYLAEVAPPLKPTRQRLAAIKSSLAGMKPANVVPVLRELAANQRRKTHIQHRGNFLDLGPEVQPGLPSAFNPAPADAKGKPLDRLTMAHWLVSADNPLTARVTVNRYWEKLMGAGLVLTSEEFGTQGELPSHPELLDWLATEFMASKWDMKKLVKLIVTSAAYQQSSRVTSELLERDPDNRLLARGPRFRLSAEQIRDQALFAAGLLSRKMYGPPVKPPQPTLGVSAAFGGGIDWQTSAGEDKFRRGIYTTWRRSNPYPSMASFDAPSREVCTIRRSRTNTPLQALVTMNDPVYVEAAQALGRRIAAHAGGTADKVRHGFRICLARPPSDAELARLVKLFDEAKARYAKAPPLAAKMATDPIGPLPAGADAAEMAAWTIVGNVLLNLDEMFMTR